MSSQSLPLGQINHHHYQADVTNNYVCLLDIPSHAESSSRGINFHARSNNLNTFAGISSHGSSVLLAGSTHSNTPCGTPFSSLPTPHDKSTPGWGSQTPAGPLLTLSDQTPLPGDRVIVRGTKPPLINSQPSVPEPDPISKAVETHNQFDLCATLVSFPHATGRDSLPSPHHHHHHHHHQHQTREDPDGKSQPGSPGVMASHGQPHLDRHKVDPVIVVEEDLAPFSKETMKWAEIGDVIQVTEQYRHLDRKTQVIVARTSSQCLQCLCVYVHPGARGERFARAHLKVRTAAPEGGCQESCADTCTAYVELRAEGGNVSLHPECTLNCEELWTMDTDVPMRIIGRVQNIEEVLWVFRSTQNRLYGDAESNSRSGRRL